MRVTPIIFRGLAVLIAAVPCVLFAEAPVIVSVVNYGRGDSQLAPGILASVHFRSAKYFDVRTDSVQVGGHRVAVSDDETGDSVTIRVPMDMPLGPTTVVLVMEAGSSAPFETSVVPYAPGIFPPTRSQFDPWGAGFFCNLPAMSGEVVNLFAVGLGRIDSGPKATVTVGARAAEIIELIEMPFPAGFYRVRFIVPPGDGMRLVSLTIGGEKSNTVRLPVGRSMVNVASTTFQEGTAAPESLVSAYSCNGSDLTGIERTEIISGTPPELPTALGGTTITVRDSNGVARVASLYGATSNQVNFVVPAGTAMGVATVTAMSGTRLIAAGDIEVQSVAPSPFFVAQVVRSRNGVQTIETIQTFSAPVIDLGPGTDQVYLVLYGTGIRYRSSPASVLATVQNVNVPVEYSGPQGDLPGLDQVNLRLPRSLAGRGMVDLHVSIDGKPAYVPSLTFQ
jgi:uncharacterized protein (TIGR03437 family)